MLHILLRSVILLISFAGDENRGATAVDARRQSRSHVGIIAVRQSFSLVRCFCDAACRLSEAREGKRKAQPTAAKKTARKRNSTSHAVVGLDDGSLASSLRFLAPHLYQYRVVAIVQVSMHSQTRTRKRRNLCSASSNEDNPLKCCASA